MVMCGYLKTLLGLRRHIAEWEGWEARGAGPHETPPLGFVISMESADPIR